MIDVTESRIRLYESALNNVRYVYGSPVRFSAKRDVLEARDVAKEDLIKRDVVLAERRRAAGPANG